MKTILDALKQIITETYAAVNAELKKLPSAEQFQANAELIYPLSCIKDAASRIGEQLMHLQGKFEAATAELRAAFVKDEEFRAELLKDAGFVASVQAELVKAGAIVEKSTHDSAVTAAIDQAKKDERTAVTAEFQRKADADKERRKLIDDKTLPQVLAEKISDDDALDATKRAATVAKLKARGDELTSAGLLEDAEQVPFVAELAGLALDAAGDALFAAKLGPIKRAVEKAAGKPPGNPLAGGNPAPAAAGGEAWRSLV